MERRQFHKPRRIAIGETVAHCEHCGSEEFFRVEVRASRQKTDMMACVTCGREHSYTALLGQIARTIMSRCERALANAEALRRELGK